MKILQRYMLREVLGPTLLALAALSLVLIIIFVFERFAEIAPLLSLPILARLILYLLPTLLCLAIPMSVLIGVLLGVGRLTVDSELKAIRTHGVSLYSLFLPILALGLAASGVVLFNSLYLAPKMMTRSLTLVQDLRTKLFQSLEPGRFEDRLSTEENDITLYFSEKDEKTSLLKDVYLWFDGEVDSESAQGDKEKKKKSDEKPLAGATDKGRLPMPLADVGNLPEYTIEYWFKTRKITEQMSAVGFGNSKTAEGSWVQCGVVADGMLRFAHADDEGVIAIAKAKSGRVDDEKWHYAACVRVPPKEWFLYADGKQVAREVRTVGKTTVDKGKIGALPRVKDDFPWDGAIGSVRISRRARTAKEIKAVWENGPEGSLTRDSTTLWLGKPPAQTEGGAGSGEDEPAEKPERTLFLGSSGSLTGDPERKSVTLTLNDGSIHLLGSQDTMYSTISFGKLRNEITLQGDEDYIAKGKDKQPQARTVGEIHKAIRDYTDRGTASYLRRARDLMAELLQRYSIAYASLAFVLIGLPLAIYIRPSGKSIGVALAFILIAVYYLIMHTGVVLTQKGSGFGPLLVFLPNVLLTLLGAILIHRTVHR